MSGEVLERAEWELPATWWGEVPPWLYDVQEHLKASWVGAFKTPILTSSGWTYDLWEVGGVRSRWRVIDGRIVPTSSILRRRPKGEDWHQIEDAGAVDPSSSERMERVAAIRLSEPDSWRLGRWGFVGRLGTGIVTGPAPAPRSPSDCRADLVRDEIGDRIGFDNRLSELAWISPDGQVRGSTALTEILSESLPHRLVCVPEGRWWDRVAGMSVWD